MADSTSAQAPTGWYPNPDDAAQDRLWDGEKWTDNVRPRQTPAPGVLKERAPTFVIAVVGFWLALAAVVFGGTAQLVVLNLGLAVAGLVLGIIAVTRAGRPKTMAIWAICLGGVGLLVTVGVATIPS